VIAATLDELRGTERFPMFVKRAVSTASSGVRRVASAAVLAPAAHELEIHESPLLVQAAVDGPLAMVQTDPTAGA
jgi:D-alanine-D-alanine ligase-like ATP-grasp enzyme